MAEETIARVTISMDSELQKKVSAMAEKDRRSFSLMAVMLIEEAIKNREKKTA